MAQLPEILDELSRISGRSPETLHHVWRLLRTAGQVQPGRRGASLPVEARSLTAMLIACMTDLHPVEIPRAVEVYRGLRPRRKGGFGRGFPSLEYVAQADTFGQALDDLLLLGPCLKREAVIILMLLFDKVPPDRLLGLEFFEVELTLQRPVPYARLTLRAVDERGVYSHEFSQEWITDSAKFMAGYYKPEMNVQTAIRTVASIDHKVIFRLGDLLAAADEEQNSEVARDEGEALAADCPDAATAASGRGRKPGSRHHRVENLRLLSG